MNKLKLLLCAFAAVFMASCSSSSDENSLVVSFEYPAKDCFTYVDNNGATAMFSGVDFVFVYDYAKNVMSMKVSGLTDGTLIYPEFYIDNLRWSYENGWKTSRGNDVAVRSSGQVPLLSSVEVKMLDRVVNGIVSPVYQINMNFESGVAFAIYPLSMTYYANTVVSAAGVDDFVSKESSYVLNLDPKTSKAVIKINNARFAQNMPVGMNMTFKDIDFNATLRTIAVNSDALVPEIGGDPYPSFGISMLNGTFAQVNGMILNFRCNAMGCDYSVSADGKVLPELMEN